MVWLRPLIPKTLFIKPNLAKQTVWIVPLIGALYKEVPVYLCSCMDALNWYHLCAYLGIPIHGNITHQVVPRRGFELALSHLAVIDTPFQLHLHSYMYIIHTFTIQVQLSCVRVYANMDIIGALSKPSGTAFYFLSSR